MKRLLTVAALLALVFSGVAHAAEINTSALSQNGWYSDDTRADGTGTQPAGTNLISPTLTDDPEATALGNPAHDADILNQILFGLPPVAPPGGTHPAAVHLRIAAGVVPGKSQISHRNTTTGFAAGTAFTDPGFFVDYNWMGDGSSVVTAAVKIGIQTSDYGSTGTSSRTGENAWDKILIYEPSNGNGGSADGAWHSEALDYNNGKWWFFDRTVVASNQSNPMTLADMATSTLAFSGTKTVQDVYNLITDPSAKITSIQVGIGSNNPGGSVYVNELETSFYRTGDLTTFGSAPVTNVTQNTYFNTISDALAAAVANDEIHVAAGTYAEAFEITVPGISIVGAGQGQTFIDVAGLAGYNSSGIHVWADNVSLSGFTLTGLPSASLPRYGIKVRDVSGCSLSDIEIHSVYRSGLDMLGPDGLVVSNLYSHNNGGTGLQTSDGRNISLQDITTHDNNWGGMGIFTWGNYTPLGVAGIVFSGSNSFGEPIPLYLEAGNYNDPLNPELITWSTDPLDGADVTLLPADAAYLLTGDSDNNNLYTVFFADLPTAQAAASYPGVFGHISTNRYLDSVLGTDLYVLSAIDGVLGQLGGVQAAVDAADVNDTVHVGTGTFTEQVEIAKDLTLSGDGAGLTNIVSPVSLPLSFNTGSNDNYPVLYVHDADPVIQNLTVDGANQGDTNYRFIGIGFWNAGGSVLASEVLNIMNSTFSGAQHGVGIYSYNNTGGPYLITLNDVDVLDYQKTAVALSGTGLTVDLDDVTCVGQGDTGVTAQNGIQLGYGAGGAVDNCVVTGNSWNGGTWTASGMLFYLATSVDVSGCTLDGNQTSIYGQDTPVVTVDGCAIDLTGAPTVSSGVLGYLTSSPKAAVRTPVAASPLVEPYVPGSSKAGAVMEVVVTNSTLIGSGAAGTYGIDAGSAGDAMTVTATGNTVSMWDYGVDLWGSNVTATVSNNALVDNVTAGLRSTLPVMVPDATCNWWGDVLGPDATGNPSPGDAVQGDVLWYPWLDNDLGSSPACVGMPSVVAAAPPAGVEITPCAPCLTVPVNYNNATGETVRGISVTFELSPELAFCTSYLVDIVPTYGAGSWADGFAAGSEVVDQILDNGDGTYTVDRAILGSLCGSDISGSVFTVGVAANVPGDAVGSITILDVTVRDCANAPVSGIAGGSANVPIDQTAPDAVTDLAAVQKKSGNDSDGTTIINLSWTAPTDPDAANVTIYRKGFGFYPEYDDAGGAVPAATTDPAGDGWTPVATVPATQTTYPDQPGTRDFWYYVAVADDGCLDSPVSNMTGGTLNYHLGDVAPPPNGNNLVYTGDISALGDGYGTVDGDGDYSAALDVGPTSDYSVDALPSTDNAIQFEDLMMFAINFDQVSKGAPAPQPAAVNEVALNVVETEGAVSVEINLSGDGNLQGISVPLRWNSAAVRPVGFSEGSLVNRQGRTGLVLSPEPGTVDAALMGVGRAGISGEGLLAVVRFERVGDGEAGIMPGEIVARDAENHELAISGTVVSNAPDGTLPKRTVLQTAYPNPFNPRTTLRFSLAKPGHVQLAVYSLSGRRVATLVNEEMTAGNHEVAWTGLDDSGVSVSSGTYLVRMVAPDEVQSQRVTLLK